MDICSTERIMPVSKATWAEAKESPGHVVVPVLIKKFRFQDDRGSRICAIVTASWLGGLRVSFMLRH